MRGKILKKGIICPVIASILMFGAGNSVLAADNTTLYEYDFEDYAGGAFAPVDSTGRNCWTTIESSRYTMVQEEDGNKGMDVVSGNPTMQYRLPEILNDGVLYISFDFIVGSDGQSYVYFTDDTENAQSNQSHRKYVLYMTASKVYGPAANLGNWGNAQVYAASEIGKKNNVQIIHDYTSKHHYTYVNGELLSDVEFSKINSDYTGTNNIRFTTHSSLDFIDNIRIAYMTDNSFYGRLKSENADEKSLLFEFSEGISNEANLETAFIRNMFTGEVSQPIQVTVENQRYLCLVFSENIAAGDEYELTLPEDFSNIVGRKLSDKIVFSTESADSDVCLSSVRIIDCDGDEHLLTEEICRPAKKIMLKFSGQPDESALTAINADWEGEYSAEVVENTVLLNFDSYFTENQEYVFTVPKSVTVDGRELAKDYTLSFKTGEGVTKVRNFKFTKDGEEVSKDDLSNGDTVTLSAEIVKTKREPASAVLSYSKWNGRKMTGFNFTDMSLGERETYSQGSMEIVVDNIDTFDLKGFLWLGIEKTNPIADFIKIK